MSRRAAPLLIEDIWEAIEKIERYVSGLEHDAFIRDEKTVDWLFEIWKSSAKPPTEYQRISGLNIPTLNGGKLSA